MDPIGIGVIVAGVLVLLSSVTVASYKGGKWTVKRVIMGVPVEWETTGERVSDDGYTSWSVTLGGVPSVPWPWRKGRK